MPAAAFNPATLSPQLAALFPAGVFAAQLCEPGRAAWLLPGEAARLGRAAPKRVNEFAAGRVCARRALEQLSIFDFPLGAREDRQPLWHERVVGSITHTEGFCAAVVAERKRFCGIGLDTEVIAHVRSALWSQICGPQEIAWIESLPPRKRQRAAALVFVAKEAFYKCQYQITAEWLDFGDVTIEVADLEETIGEFAVHPNTDIALAAHGAVSLPGRFRFHDAWVSAGVAVAAIAPDGAPQFQ